MGPKPRTRIRGKWRCILALNGSAWKFTLSRCKDRPSIGFLRNRPPCWDPGMRSVHCRWDSIRGFRLCAGAGTKFVVDSMGTVIARPTVTCMLSLSLTRGTCFGQADTFEVVTTRGKTRCCILKLEDCDSPPNQGIRIVGGLFGTCLSIVLLGK
jgi:hypothetical protein